MKPMHRHLIAVVIVLTVGLPFVQLLLWSFSDRWFYPGLLPQQWGLRAWEYIFGTAGVQVVQAVFQSVAVAAVTAVSM